MTYITPKIIHFTPFQNRRGTLNMTQADQEEQQEQQEEQEH